MQNILIFVFEIRRIRRILLVSGHYLARNLSAMLASKDGDLDDDI